VSEPTREGTGWVLFAGIMLMIAATLNVVWGIAAVAGSGVFVTGADYILVADPSTWGWIAIGFGALEFLAAVSIWRGGGFGRWFGIFVTSLTLSWIGAPGGGSAGRPGRPTPPPRSGEAVLGGTGDGGLPDRCEKERVEPGDTNGRTRVSHALR
jgi:hypothetical protein